MLPLLVSSTAVYHTVQKNKPLNRMRLPESETKVNSTCTRAAAVMKLALLGLSRVFRQQDNPCDFENGLMDRLFYLQTGAERTQATTDVGSGTSQHTWRNSVRHHVQWLSCLRHKHRPAVCRPRQPWYQRHHFCVWEIDVNVCERVEASGVREKDVAVFARGWGLKVWGVIWSLLAQVWLKAQWHWTWGC